MLQRNKFHIGGQWVAPLGSGSINVVNASMEQVMDSIRAATEADANAAIGSACAAFEA